MESSSASDICGSSGVDGGVASGTDVETGGDSGMTTGSTTGDTDAGVGGGGSITTGCETGDGAGGGFSASTDVDTGGGGSLGVDVATISKSGDTSAGSWTGTSASTCVVSGLSSVVCLPASVVCGLWSIVSLPYRMIGPGTYPIWLATERTWLCVVGLIRRAEPLPESTFETVALLTPAATATSFMEKDVLMRNTHKID